jgi:hypothetical protein
VSVPHARGFLLLRRAGGVWGVASADVEGLASRRGGYRVSVASHTLAADEILGVVEDLRVRPPAPVLRRFCPPAALRLDEGEEADEASE